MASIFISYRRDDSAGLAGRLYDRLERQFARRELFIDIDSIEAGADFEHALERTLAASRIVLVLIGRRWLDIQDPKGARRLDDPGDYVRREIEAALARDGVKVVPVLLEGAEMPAPDALPESLRALTRRQAIELRTSRFGPDCDDLMRALKTMLAPKRRVSPALLAGAAALVVVVGGVALAQVSGLLSFGGATPGTKPDTSAKLAPPLPSSLVPPSSLPPPPAQAAAPEPRPTIAVEAGAAVEAQPVQSDTGVFRTPALDAPPPEEARLRTALATPPPGEASLAVAQVDPGRSVVAVVDPQRAGEVARGMEAVRIEAARQREAERAASSQAPDAARRDAEAARLRQAALALADAEQVARERAEEAKRRAEAARADEERLRVASLVPPKPPEPAMPTAPAGIGAVFQECPTCPAMVTIPAGRVLIGSPPSERGRGPEEGPQREVAIPAPLAISRTPVTFDQWDACLAEGGCNAHKPGDYGWGRGGNPVIFVSHADAADYAGWLSRKTGQRYRLLSEAEYEFATRACLVATCRADPFWFGAAISPDKANYDWRLSYDGSPKAQAQRRAQPADAGPANGFGLKQMAGNVRAWVEDCWLESYDRMPGDGSARVNGDCTRRVTRGGSWSDDPKALRSAARGWEVADHRGRSAQIGIRVAREIAR